MKAIVSFRKGKRKAWHPEKLSAVVMWKMTHSITRHSFQKSTGIQMSQSINRFFKLMPTTNSN
jgi:hypothetical protein